MPKVSVIISSYNHAPYIGQAIESVLAQDFQDFEIIVTDDASTDNTLEVLAQFDDPRLKVISFTENRREHMKNEALARATGEYVAILNSDDLMRPQRLSKQVHYLDQNPEILAVFSAKEFVNEKGKVTGTTPAVNKSRHQWLRHFLDKDNPFGHSTAMIRRSFFQQHGPYNRWLILCSDIDLWVRICFHGEVQVLDTPLTAIRKLPNEQNLGGRTPATHHRGGLEYPLVIDHYFQKENLPQLPLIFPERVIGTSILQRRLFLANYLKDHRRNTVRFLANLRLYETIQSSGNSVDEIRAFYRLVAETDYPSPPLGVCQIYDEKQALLHEAILPPNQAVELKWPCTSKALSLDFAKMTGAIKIERMAAIQGDKKVFLKKHMQLNAFAFRADKRHVVFTGREPKMTLALPSRWTAPYRVLIRLRWLPDWNPDTDSTPGKADKTVRNSLVSRLLRWIK